MKIVNICGNQIRDNPQTNITPGNRNNEETLEMSSRELPRPAEPRGAPNESSGTTEQLPRDVVKNSPVTG